MKLVTFRLPAQFPPVDRIGALVDGDRIISLQGGYAEYLRREYRVERSRAIAASIIPADMAEFLDGGDYALQAAKTAVDHVLKSSLESAEDGDRLVYHQEEVKLRAPIPRPRMIMDFLAFEQHVRNMRRIRGVDDVPKAWYENPTCYKKRIDTVIADGEDILWPRYTEKLDYELELAICIGRKGKNIPKERALEYVAGYTVFNDVSARDIQAKEVQIMGPFKGKDFDNSAPMGPCLVTSDEIPDPQNLKMVVRVNGEVRAEAHTKDMYWKVADLVSYTSIDETLYPAYILGSGTPGFGSGMELGKWIQVGDIVELEIEKIGKLRNRVAKSP